MAVTAFQDLVLADEDREWDGDAAEKRVRRWADAEDGPNEKYRDAHVWYDADSKDNFTAYKLLDRRRHRRQAAGGAARGDGGRQRDAGRPRRGGHSGAGRESGQVPSGEVLQEDGPHPTLGGLSAWIPGCTAAGRRRSPALRLLRAIRRSI